MIVTKSNDQQQQQQQQPTTTYVCVSVFNNIPASQAARLAHRRAQRPTSTRDQTHDARVLQPLLLLLMMMMLMMVMMMIMPSR
jgi:hypothetical protein